MPAFSRAGEGGISRKNKSSVVSLPIILKKKVNFAKIKKEGKEELAQWTETKVTTMLSFEDEVLNGLIVNMFDECSETGEAVEAAPIFREGKHGDVHVRALAVSNKLGRRNRGPETIYRSARGAKEKKRREGGSV